MRKKALKSRIVELESENATLVHFVDRLTVIGTQIDAEYRELKEVADIRLMLAYASAVPYCTCGSRMVFIGIEKDLVKHECIKCGSIHWYNATSNDICIPLKETPTIK